MCAGSWLAIEARQLGSRLCCRIHSRERRWSALFSAMPETIIRCHEADEQPPSAKSSTYRPSGLVIFVATRPFVWPGMLMSSTLPSPKRS